MLCLYIHTHYHHNHLLPTLLFESHQVEPDCVREIPERAPLLKLKNLKEGKVYDCWYANEEEWYPATVEMITESGTVMVT
jgi:hypothetical protein